MLLHVKCTHNSVWSVWHQSFGWLTSQTATPSRTRHNTFCCKLCQFSLSTFKFIKPVNVFSNNIARYITCTCALEIYFTGLFGVSNQTLFLQWVECHFGNHCKLVTCYGVNLPECLKSISTYLVSFSLSSLIDFRDLLATHACHHIFTSP